MNCEQACELIALAASGDVTAAEQSAIAAHMVDCMACRDEAVAFSALTSQLALMRDDSVPDYAFTAVRAQVASEIVRHKRPAWLTAWPAFAAVVACSVMLVILLRPEAPRLDQPDLPEPVAIAAIASPVEAPAVAPVRRIRKSAPPKIQNRTEPLVVKMLTEDPDVIIYWIADAKREGSEKGIIQ